MVRFCDETRHAGNCQRAIATPAPVVFLGANLLVDLFIILAGPVLFTAIILPLGERAHPDED